MAPQRYERVPVHDEDESPTAPKQPFPIPASPPPSFHSRASSPTSPSARRLLSDDPLATDAERTLADTFDSPSDDEEEGHGPDDRQRLMRGNSSQNDAPDSHTDDPTPGIVRRVTQLPVAPESTSGKKVYGGGMNDGVFANLSAKPTRGEELEEKPPSYEQAAADATPPYWDTTTILTHGMASDEVFIDGLPVGSVFSFIWNGMISMSFQIVGFLLTYLLHTTHAAKNGSRAGLGITLIQYGFQVKGAPPVQSGPPSGDFSSAPTDPNSHDLNSGSGDAGSGSDSVSPAFSPNDWLAYILMIMGWFILIKSISDFIRARRHEQLVLQSPDRGLGVAVVAEGERPEQSV